MKKSELKRIIREQVKTVLKEEIEYIDDLADSNMNYHLVTKGPGIGGKGEIIEFSSYDDESEMEEEIENLNPKAEILYHGDDYKKAKKFKK